MGKIEISKVFEIILILIQDFMEKYVLKHKFKNWKKKKNYFKWKESNQNQHNIKLIKWNVVGTFYYHNLNSLIIFYLSWNCHKKKKILAETQIFQ